MSKQSEIVVTVDLDENNVPQHIKWSSGADKQQGDCKTFFMSLWDEKEKNTMHLHLWTKQMLVDEMKQFIHQSLLGYADTVKRATGEENLSTMLSDFCHEFALKAGILKNAEQPK
ncbi:MAG: gliding motility protein GldC [Bacteroidia bacterium]|jgi:gliding motility-associated protein GldC|nr:gliding motility protein GldC [Bacteroidia bacterium]